MHQARCSVFVHGAGCAKIVVARQSQATIDAIDWVFDGDGPQDGPSSRRGTEPLHGRFLANGSIHAQAMNDDRSPLLTLLSCIVCKTTMRLERSYPGDDGKDIIQYRCEQCGRIERVGLVRGSWPLPS